MSAFADTSGPIKCSMDSRRFTSTICPTPECTATMVAKAATIAVTSSVNAMGGSVGPPSGSPLTLAKPDIASAIEAKPGRSRYGPVWPKPVTRVITSLGFTASRTSGSSPSASSFPGRKFSTRTSAVSSNLRRTEIPSSDFRSRTIVRFPRPTIFQNNVTSSEGSRHPMSRTVSPVPGRSTLMTSAPKSASCRAHPGPARTVEISTTRRSDRGGFGTRQTLTGGDQWLDTHFLTNQEYWIARRRCALVASSRAGAA